MSTTLIASRGHYSVRKKLPVPGGNFVLSSTEEFRWDPISQQGYSQSIRMSVCAAVERRGEGGLEGVGFASE